MRSFKENAKLKETGPGPGGCVSSASCRSLLGGAKSGGFGGCFKGTDQLRVPFLGFRVFGTGFRLWGLSFRV